MSLYSDELKLISELDYNWNQLNNKTVFISGGTGFVGQFLIDVLKYRNKYFNSNIKIISCARRSVDSCSEVEYLKHDITQPLNLNHRTLDYIIHLASNTHPEQYASDPVGTIATNVFGCHNLLETARKSGTKRFLLASSVEIYGEGTSAPMDESFCGYIDCNTARAGYNEAKRLCESLCQSYKAQYGIECVIGRFARIFGANKRYDSKAIAQFMAKALSKEDIILKSEGKQRYSFCYIADAVSGLLCILLNGKSGEAYNIANDDENMTLGDYAKFIADIARKEVVYDFNKKQAGASVATYALLNCDKIKRLGWQQQYGVKQGLERTYKILSAAGTNVEKKILYLENDFNHGGIEKVSLDILEQLASSGSFQIDLCLLFEGGEWDSRVPSGVNKVNIFDIPMDEVRSRIKQCDNKYSLTVNLKKGKIFSAAKIIFQKKYRKNRALRYGDLFSHIKQDRYDYLISSSLSVTVLQAIAANVNADKKYVWLHRAFCEYRDIKKFNLDRCTAAESLVHDVELYEKFDKIVCVSGFVKSLFDYYFKNLRDRSIVLYNAMDVKKIKTLAEQSVTDISKDTNILKIATVGRIEREKGPQLAINAARILKKRQFDFLWYFVGDGTLLKKMQKAVLKYGLENNVKFIGSRNNPYPYIKACDVYCQPSLTEAYCTTVNEARILGKAVVANRFSGITEQITNGSDGIICDISPNALADALTEAFDANYRSKLEAFVKYPNDNEKISMFSVDKLFVAE